MATPLNKEGKIDSARVGDLVDRMIDGGIDGLLPLGTSGEFALLSRSERSAVIKAVVNRANGRVPVIAGVSDPSVDNIREFSADAKDIGVDGVICTPPYYYSTTDDSLLDYYADLAAHVDVPLMVYNIPEWTHQFVPPEIVKSLAEKKIIVGMKYTENNILRLLTFIEELRGRDIAVFTGSDAMTYAALEFGAAGAIIGVANVAPRMASKIFDDFRARDTRSARETQMRLIPLIRAIEIGKFPSGLKEAMKLAGFPIGPAKAPLPPPTKQELDRIRQYLRKAGDFS
jgi:4-hydroxy-tetrahydrodipicolinate synthase